MRNTLQGMQNLASAPIATQRSIRTDRKRTITSFGSGKIAPIAAFALLREDSLRSSSFQFDVALTEMADIVQNNVHCTVEAHLVPWLAMERFNGSLDRFNRSYREEPDPDTDVVLPFFETAVMPETRPDIYKAMGIHADAGTPVNTMYAEAYNQIINYRRKQRSVNLPLRTMDETTLARGFWPETEMRHIKASFDAASDEGEVPLSVTGGSLPVRNLYAHYLTGSEANMNPPINEPGGPEGGPGPWYAAAINDLNASVHAELAEDGISVSLANIDMARQTRAFARWRDRYQNLEEEFIIDLLMDGIRVPELGMAQPMLLGRATGIFGQQKRYATNGGDLHESAVNAGLSLGMNIRAPRVNTGGVVMFTASVVPEQLYERQRDYFFFANDVEFLPEYTKDFLDPLKVVPVENDHIDVMHSLPSDLFGYAPLNHQWQVNAPRLGGKFYKPGPDAIFKQERVQFWATDVVDPILSEDFYLCGDLPEDIFLSSSEDVVELALRGEAIIEGNTVFGAALREATDSYQTIMDSIDKNRIDVVLPPVEKPVPPAGETE